ncbi:Uncharacterised protein [Vibrio cholerae]|nr:Uncharacterised protein [Vibrio cholerae]
MSFESMTRSSTSPRDSNVPVAEHGSKTANNVPDFSGKPRNM